MSHLQSPDPVIVAKDPIDLPSIWRGLSQAIVGVAMDFRLFRLVTLIAVGVVVLALPSGFALEQELEPTKTGKAPVKPQNPALVQVEEVAGLPRVLLIGDSISMGYTLEVRERLKGVANVHRPPQNCGDSATGLKQLDRWLGTGTWDVIHFNFGLHDLKYLDAQGKYVSPEHKARRWRHWQFTASGFRISPCGPRPPGRR